MALIAAVLACVLPPTASALESGISLTPSSTKPYYACPEGPCGAIIDPAATETASGYKLPSGGPLLEGSGENGGYSPKDLQSAYGIPTTGGSTQTVALIDAYGDATAESDLAKYREKYGLSVCTTANGCFAKVNQKGEEANYPHSGEGLEQEWGFETSLDLDMVSAACPKCHILLVEATTQYAADTSASVETAASLGATEISNSYGYPENYEPWCGKTGCAQYASAYNQSVPVTASSGDSGYRNGGKGVEFPAAAPTVIAVGGTSLSKAANSRGWSEKVWFDTGSGCSEFEPKPSWQVEHGCRVDNDVATDAACETPVSVYSTPEWGGWANACGTSASAPLIAGIEAHANSYTRSVGGEAFYVVGPKGGFFDVTEGADGSCGGSFLCEAKTGYDGPTGWGTPNGVFNATPDPPENTVLPVVSLATPDQAVPETTTTGSWTNKPTSYKYQWRRCNASGEECVNISGATQSTYMPGEADVEHTLVARVTATNAGGSTSAYSKATNKVKPIGQITEYSLPAGTRPEGIAAGPDGNIWFTEAAYGGKVGKITPSGTITEYTVPTGTESLNKIAAGPDGRLWFTAKHWNGSAYEGRITKVTTTGAFVTYTLAKIPKGITAGPDGNMWFTANKSTIGKITTSGAITEYSLIREGHPAERQAREIVAGPDGNLWFSEEGGAECGKITTSGIITEYILPGAAYGVAPGPDGNIWFADGSASAVTKITPSGLLTTYSLPKSGTAIGVTAGPDGNLWFGLFGSPYRIARSTPLGSFTEFALTGFPEPRGMTSGPDGNVWFAEAGTSKIANITP